MRQAEAAWWTRPARLQGDSPPAPPAASFPAERRLGCGPGARPPTPAQCAEPQGPFSGAGTQAALTTPRLASPPLDAQPPHGPQRSETR